MTIKELVEKYEAYRAFYLTNGYNETLLRNDFLDPFFELLGWDIKNNAGKPTNEREVLLEESLKANISEHSKKPDYTFRLFSQRKFFVEAKKPFVAIETDAETAKQIRRYGFTAKLKISVLSNFEHLIIYDTSVEVDKADIFSKARVKLFHYTEYIEKFEEIARLLGKYSVYSGAFDHEWEYIEAKINKYSVDNLFLRQINHWRIVLGTEIFRHQPDIDEQRLNDVVQSYLNRILFLRVCEDRNLEDYKTLLSFANAIDFESLIKKFRQADKRYNSGLFDQLLSDELVGNVSSVFWDIIKHLYYPDSPYSFAVFSSDVLGRIYEIFLSEKLAIQKGAIVLARKPENIDRDIVTTPTYIIQEILRNTVLRKCDGKTDEEILMLKLADIACGSGAFLLEAFQLLQDVLIDYYLRTDSSRLIQTNINTYKLPFSIKRKLLLSCIFGVDKDFNAVEATKFGLLLKLLEEEDMSSTGAEIPVLPELDPNIFFGNSLLASHQVADSQQTAINPFDFQSKFDVIVGNPPYMKSEDMKNITPLELPLYKQIYTSAYKQFDKYFLFIERGLQLLNKEGLLGYIVPSKFAKVGAGKKLRKRLTINGHLDTIVSFGANQVFADRTTYTCLLILSRQKKGHFQYTEVRNLTRWITRAPGEIQSDVKRTDQLDDEVWVLVPPGLKSAYRKIIAQSIKLVDLVGKDNVFNGIQTSANPIYIFRPTGEDDLYYYFVKKEVAYKIEKSITKPYFETSRGNDGLHTYRTFQPNARVIYPYENVEDGVEVIPLIDIQEQYPYAYDYLLAHKDILSNPKRDVKPPPVGDDEWHRYGRHQSLDSCGLPAKIIVGVLSVGDKYAVDTHGTFISSGGTAGYCVVALPEQSPYSIYYLQAALNSKYLEWCSALYGEVFRGGYIARGTKVLKNLPLPKIDFSDPDQRKTHDAIANIQQELISVHDQMDIHKANSRDLIPLKRQFLRLRAQLEGQLRTLFHLGDDDSKIPLIKELYEAH